MSVTDARLRPRKTPRQSRAERTRERILDAAAHVFGEHGYAAGTTNRIAADAGVSIGTLYQYFPNKDAILVELMRRHVDDGVAAIQRRLGAVGELPEAIEDRLRVFVEAALDNHAGDGRLHQVLFEESPRPRPLLDELHALEAQAVEVVAAMLGADASVEVADERLSAWLVIATIESLVHRFAGAGFPYPREAFTAEVTRMLAVYLKGDAASAAVRPTVAPGVGEVEK